MSKLGLDGKCPPPKSVSSNIPAFRWVYERIEDEFTFTPQGLKPNRRINSKDDLEKCSFLGLSMFETLEKAQEHFNVFPKTTQLKMGYKNIAVGDIEKSDGVITEINKDGHFDLHEYERVDLSLKFKIVGSLWK